MRSPVLSPGTRLRGHDLLAHTLQRLGVTHVFGVSGTPIHQTLAACSRVGVRPIGVRHQQSGVLMATAHSYVSGRLSAVAIASAGPGVTNCLTGLYVAHDNAWPLVVLGGRREPGAAVGSFQSLDALPIVQPITKWCAAVERCQDLPETLAKAFTIATSGRPGPVYLDISETALGGSAAVPESLPPMSVSRAALDQQALDCAAELLAQARRPALIIGKGVRWSEPCDELRRLVELLGMPFITSPMGAGFLPDDHPQCRTAVGGLVQQNADVALVVGARLNWQFRFGAHLVRGAKLIHIDIHEPELQHGVRQTVKIVGDAKEALQALLDRIEENAKCSNNRGLSRSWLEALRETETERPRPTGPPVDSDDGPISPYTLAEAVARQLPKGAITVFDANVNMLVAQEVIPCVEPVTRLNAGTNGCMGVGLPFAIGARLARPERPVVAICGDCAFGFSAMEMETAVRHRVPVVIVVANNGGISGARVQTAYYPPTHDRVAMYGADVRYEQIAEAVGGHAEYVESLPALEPALQRALDCGRASCIHVKVAPDCPPPDQFP